jgi:hypothetical protein
MKSNTKLKNLIGSEVKNSSDNGLSQVKELMIELARLKYVVNGVKSDKINADKSNNLLDISSKEIVKIIV